MKKMYLNSLTKRFVVLLLGVVSPALVGAQCGWDLSFAYGNSSASSVNRYNNVMYDNGKFFYVESGSNRIANIFGSTWEYGVLDNTSQPVRAYCRFRLHNGQFYYIGTNNRIYRTMWSLGASKWVTEQVNIYAPDVRSNSHIDVASNGDVFFVGTDSKIRRIYGSGNNQWQLMPAENLVDTHSDLVVDNDNRVWFLRNGALVYYHKFYGQYDPWGVIPLLANNWISPYSPIIIRDKVNDFNDEVFWVNTSGYLSQSVTSSVPHGGHSTWTWAFNAQVSRNSFAVGDDKIVYVGDDGKIWNAYKDASGTLHNNPLSSAVVAGSPSPIHFGNSLPVTFGGGQSVFSNKLMMFEWDGSGCQTVGQSGGFVMTEANMEKRIEVYPNPAKDNIFIESVGYSNHVEVSIYNMAGIQFYNKTVNVGEKVTLNISDLASGIYILKTTASGEVNTQKIVKQ